MDIIFVKMAKYLVPIAILLQKIGFKIFYLRLSESLQKNDSSWVTRLQEKNIIPLPIESLHTISGFSRGHSDPEMKTYELTRQYASDKLLQTIGRLFPDNKYIEKKLRILLHHPLSIQEVYVTNTVNIWGRAKPERNILLIDVNITGLLTHELLPNVKILVVPVDFIASGVTHLFKAVNRLVRSAKENTHQPDHVLSRSFPSHTKQNRVAFVVHKGLTYGALFYKDLYYSTKRDSDLYPINLLHLDYSGLQSPSDTLSWDHIGNHRQSWIHNIYHGLVAVCYGIFHVRALRHIIGLFIIARSYVIFQSFTKQLEKYTSLGFALIDYEVLCPKELLLASEARGIQTIAAQERFILAINNHVSLILDHYLCGSSFVAEKMQQSPLNYINRYVPVGQYRSDYLWEAKESVPPAVLEAPLRRGNTVVTALGFHTPMKWSDSQVDPLLNWTAHRHFLEDMIRLSQDVPNIFIVLRYKEVNWMSLPVFADILETINSSEKIVISTDYSKPNISYDLCAHSDLVIAKHTSLGDECLSVGIPVLFHEYTHNTVGIVSDSFDYSPANIMCYTYQELLEKTKIVLSGTPNALTEDYEYLRNVVYGGLGDGKVRERIHEYIEGLLSEH